MKDMDAMPVLTMPTTVIKLKSLLTLLVVTDAS
jgi:hypothetical protein